MTKIAPLFIFTLFSGGSVFADTSGRYVNCMDYSTVGSGLCRPDDPVPEAPARNQPKVDPVKEFLENHGKPPREFVEFYLNPTPENAQKWNQSFREQQMKVSQVAAAWQNAMRGDTPSQTSGQSTGSNTGLLQNQRVNEPVSPQTPSPAPAARPESSKVTRLGAFATSAEQGGWVTYYFSVSDPLSARMSEDFKGVIPNLKSKYRFTCVDLTPLSDKVQAQPSNRGALPCDWRLPRSGELETYKIQQTPVILIQRTNQPPELIKGVIKPDRLRKLLQ